jgi:hypothetical protein
LAKYEASRNHEKLGGGSTKEQIQLIENAMEFAAVKAGEHRGENKIQAFDEEWKSAGDRCSS